MISRLFLFLIAVILLSKSGILPEPVTQMIEQTINILLGILFVIAMFLIAPGWIAIFSSVLVATWLYVGSPTQTGTGNNASGNTERTIIVTGQEAKR